MNLTCCNLERLTNKLWQLRPRLICPEFIPGPQYMPKHLAEQLTTTALTILYLIAIETKHGMQ